MSGAGCSGAEFIRTTQPQGYIASITTEESQCGGIDTPWLVEVEPGQRINFTLWNFNGHTGGFEDVQFVCTILVFGVIYVFQNVSKKLHKK